MSHYIPQVHSLGNKLTKTIKNQDENFSKDDKKFLKNFETKYKNNAYNKDLSSHKTSTYTSKTLLNKILEFLSALFHSKHHNENQSPELLIEDILPFNTNLKNNAQTTLVPDKNNIKSNTLCPLSKQTISHTQNNNSEDNQSEVTEFDTLAENEDQSIDILIKNKSIKQPIEYTFLSCLKYQQKEADEFILVHTAEIMQEIRESKDPHQLQDDQILLQEELDASGKYDWYREHNLD